MRDPIKSGTDVCVDETVAFVYPDEEKQLLFGAEKILSVRSCDGETLYEDGKDYVLRRGRLARGADSAIPFLTPELLYSPGDQPLLRTTGPDGNETPLYFSNGAMGRFQVRVTYTHDREAAMPLFGGRFDRFLGRLERGADATVFFAGDSITYGCDASLTHGVKPFQPSYPILFALALARMYSCSVRFAPPDAPGAYPGPFPDAPRGDRGTLTLVNTAVGGWNSQDGAENLDTHVAPQLEKYGCDLFVAAYGMNDGFRDPGETAANCETIARRVLRSCPDASVLLVSTMLPNPDAVNGWNANQSKQEPALLNLAERLRSEGVPCGVARMTSVSARILDRKRFLDVTGNNVNHPNDYLIRVYAAVLLETLTGRGLDPFRADLSGTV